MLRGADDIRVDLRWISDFIHEHPEIGFQEFQAFQIQMDFLKKHNWSIQTGFAGLPTSYRAEKVIGSGDSPAFAYFAEFDALPDLGHACGHNLICVSALGAAELAAETLQAMGGNGKIILYGTPGEEVMGGKVRMAAAGCFRDADAGVISHPYDISSMDDGALSVSRYTVKFHGRASHAAIAPTDGINALDALIAFFNGVALWRQQLPESARVHGIIKKGGVSANIIPDETEAFFYVRAPSESMRISMEKRFHEIAQGAAAAAGCTTDVEFVSGYRSCKVNPVLNQAYADYRAKNHLTTRYAKGTEGRGSTDFGDVSQLILGANLHFGICEKPGIPLHSIGFREAAKTSYAFDRAMECAEAMADIGIRFCSDPVFCQQVKDAF